MLDWWNSSVLINSQLKGVFIGDKEYPELDNNIFVLYKFMGSRWFLGFEEVLQDTDYFVTKYDPNKQSVMFVYNVPEKHQNSYNMFKQSKYSQIDTNLKKQIVNFHGKEQTKKAVAVMYRHESMYIEWENIINKDLPYSQHIKISRDQEASAAIDMNAEIYDNSLYSIPKGLSNKEDNFLKERGTDNE